MSNEPDEEAVERFIADHPGGGTFLEIADFMGLTHQRVQQLVNRAVEKCLYVMARRGIRRVEDVI